MRYLDLTLPGIAANLALDEALLVAAEERGAGEALRLWEPATPAVVLGASCRVGDDVLQDACQADGVPLARRSSGGGTVVIGPGALNVTVVLAAATPALRAVDLAQAHVLDRIAQAIAVRGPAVEVLGLGDLTLGRRKFSGSAQRRLRDHFLVHASILYDFPLDLVARYLRLPRRQPAYREGRPHDQFLTNLPLPRHLLVDAIRDAWLAPGQAPERVLPHEDLVADLARDKFADPAWIERL
jgi:lipoate-protein ligase A